MKIFLRTLACFYFIGFFLHLLDILNLRLKFSGMNLTWQCWIVLLLVSDLLAAIGLWQQKTWGIYLFIFISAIQLIAYSGPLDSPRNQIFLIGFHLLSIGTYAFLKFRKEKSI